MLAIVILKKYLSVALKTANSCGPMLSSVPFAIWSLAQKQNYSSTVKGFENSVSPNVVYVQELLVVTAVVVGREDHSECINHVETDNLVGIHIMPSSKVDQHTIP